MELFGSRDIVLYYDRASRIRFRDAGKPAGLPAGRSRIRRPMPVPTLPASCPKDPFRVLTLLGELFFGSVWVRGKKGIACIIDYAETIVPVSEGGAAGSEDRNVLVTLQKWSPRSSVSCGRFYRTAAAPKM